MVLSVKAYFDRFVDRSLLPEDWEFCFVRDLPRAEVLAMSPEFDYVLSDSVFPIDREWIDQMKKVKMIQTIGVAFNQIDLAAAKEKGILVCNNAGTNSTEVAEHAIMLMLATRRRLLEGDYEMRRANQKAIKEQMILDGIPEMQDTKVGILGFGAIGKELAKRLIGFGCQLYYYDKFRRSAQEEEEYQVTFQEADELLRESDIVSVHLPVTPETTHFICEKTLKMMKPSAILVNTARGEIVNEEDLRQALIDGTIAGAGLDVLTPEPVHADNPLLNLPEEKRFKVTLTPHVAGTGLKAFQRMHNYAIENLKRLDRGEEPINRVNR